MYKIKELEWTLEKYFIWSSTTGLSVYHIFKNHDDKSYSLQRNNYKIATDKSEDSLKLFAQKDFENSLQRYLIEIK